MDPDPSLYWCGDTCEYEAGYLVRQRGVDRGAVQNFFDHITRVFFLVFFYFGKSFYFSYLAPICLYGYLDTSR